MPGRFTAEKIAAAVEVLTQLRDHQVAMARSWDQQLARVPPDYRPSALNLLHYLALRQHNLQPLQQDLSYLGLSSLGRTEAHALAGVDAVLAALHKLAARTMERPVGFQLPVDFSSGPQALARHTEFLLGPAPAGREVRIMVTMPTEAADSYDLVRDLLRAGMDVMRINSAHDEPAAWRSMAEHLRRATAEVGRPCRVLFDLQGPKLRTGPVEPGPAVVHWSPRRGQRGQLLRGVMVRLAAASAGGPAPRDQDILLPVEALWLGEVRPGDDLLLADCRGMSRRLRVVAVDAQGVLTESRSTAYVETGAAVHWQPAHPSPAAATDRTVAGRIGSLPACDHPLILQQDDILVLTGLGKLGHPATRSADGKVLMPACIPCTLPQVFADVQAGQRILFDDGKIGGLIEDVASDRLRVRITHAAGGARLRADKGINLPDSNLRVASLSDQDLAHLEFAVAWADMVGLSFVRSPQDVLDLECELDRRSGSHLGIVLKVETRVAFEQLPNLLLTALQSPPVGVMVARGDLAVEMGFERLAEVQEQILWLCEAAHVPVIWATQVLESLAKKGLPSRAEVTDAAMSGRAECVMLNKGPHVLTAVRFLDNVMTRMQAHQAKKRAVLRKLSVSDRLVDTRPVEQTDPR